MTAHRPLDDDLQILWNLLVTMHALVDEQLADAIDAMVTGNLEEAQRVHSRDDEVDRLEMEIDRQCERILALQTPVAVDLRLIITAVKINTDLERIGDHAKNIAKSTALVADSKDLIDQTQLVKMADTVRAILNEVQEAFQKRDPRLARRVIAQDASVDELHDQTVRRIVELVHENPAHADALLHLVTMSKAIERISDHATNIAEMVFFLIEGVDVRHKGLERLSEG